MNLPTEMFIQEGHSYFENSRYCKMYKHLCNNFEMREYLKKPIPNVHVQFISKYRLSSHMHQLEIERGRFYNIPRNDRVCKLYSLSQIEDEFYFILICPFYKEIGKMYVKNIIMKSFLSLNSFISKSCVIPIRMLKITIKIYCFCLV